MPTGADPLGIEQRADTLGLRGQVPVGDALVLRLGRGRAELPRVAGQVVPPDRAFT